MRLIIILSFLIISLVFAFEAPSNNLEVIFFDVGQGDAILANSPAGYRILIDGGQGRAVLEYLGDYLPFFEKKLDLIVLTHPHRDHLEGLIEIVRRYDVSLIMMTGIEHSKSRLYQTFLEEINQRNIPILIADSDRDIIFPDGTKLDILWPQKPLSGLHFDDINASSIVIRLSYDNQSYFLSGDTTMNEERELVRLPLYLASETLKVAHHGSKTSSSEEFLQVIHPKTAIISVGKQNRYGHPSAEVLERLQRHRIKIHRTDEEGTMLFPPPIVHPTHHVLPLFFYALSICAPKLRNFSSIFSYPRSI